MRNFNYSVRQILEKEKLTLPSGVCFNPTNESYYITDMQSHCVQSFMLSDLVLRPLSRSIKYDDMECLLRKPLAITWDAYWGLVITDAEYNEVFFWNTIGACWEPLVGAVHDSPLFSLPGGVTGDGSGNIFVSDFHNNRVCCINKNKEIKFIKLRLADGSSILKPYGIFCTGSELYITDAGNNRVVRYDLNTQKSNVVNLNTQSILRPIAVAVYQQNYLYVCEQRRILCYDSFGTCVLEINAKKWKEVMQDTGIKTRLVYAGAITVTSDDSLVFIDTIKGKVYQIQYGQVNL